MDKVNTWWSLTSLSDSEQAELKDLQEILLNHEDDSWCRMRRNILEEKLLVTIKFFDDYK